MKEIEFFEIIKRELIWGKQAEEKYKYNNLGIVKSVSKATEIVNDLNRKNRNEQIVYFYKDLKFELYDNAEN